MHYIKGNNRYYICGVPGNYAIKSTGNNRIVTRGIFNLKQARSLI